MLEGDFTNDGKRYQPGTSLHVKAGKVHGPHATEKGCTVLALWTDRASSQNASLSDFSIPTAAGE